MSLRSANVCPDHPNTPLIEDYRAGDTICPDCGRVVGDRVIDVGQEWRTFANDEGKDRSRVGDAQNTLLSGTDLSTTVGAMRGKGDINQFASLYKHRGDKAVNAQDKALMTAFREIATQANRIELASSIIDLAKRKFKDVYEMKILKGRPVAAISAACIFIACREQGVPRSFKEIVVISQVPKKEIARCFKTIYKHVKTVKIKPTASEGEFILRFADNLSLPREVATLAKNIADKVSDLDVAAGRNPLGIAASALFMAVHLKRTEDATATLKDICDVCGIAETTAKQTCRLLLSRYQELLPPDKVFPIGKMQLEAML